MFHQIGERVVNLRFGDHVIVVQDEEKLRGAARQGIDERLQDGAQGRLRRLMRAQIGQERSTETGLTGIQRGERI